MYSRLALCARWPTLAVVVASLAGCAAVGPDYRAPSLSETEVPGRWSSPTDTAMTTAAPVQAALPKRWWSELSDPALDRLVDEAFATSPTLDAALAKLAQSRSSRTQADAAALPSVGASAQSERLVDDSTGKSYQDSYFSTDSSWEIDFFGSVRRGKEGAQAREEAQRATLADARVSLSADVTDAYLSFRACQSHLALSEQDVASRTATEKLTAASVETGFTAPYQAIRSTASVAEAKTRLAETQAQCKQLENLLTRLTGVVRPSLTTILAEKPTGLGRLPVPRHFDVAIPQQALLQRPDIRAAERRLAAASADIGLAEADRYPRLTLNGSLGYSANTVSGGGLLSFGNWSFGPSLSLPIFDGGRRAAEVEKARARYEESLANYKSITRGAIQEVEDALTRYAAAHERAENARVAATKYQRFFDVVEERYREGASNLLELEDARRAMLNAQQTLLSVQRDRLQAWIALNRASGGGALYGAETSSAAGDQPVVQAGDAIATTHPVH